MSSTIAKKMSWSAATQRCTLKIECFECVAALGVLEGQAILLHTNRVGTETFYINASASSERERRRHHRMELALVGAAGALDR